MAETWNFSLLLLLDADEAPTVRVEVVVVVRKKEEWIDTKSFIKRWVSFVLSRKCPSSHLLANTPRKRETKVETRRDGARDDRDGRRPRRDSSRRVRFVPFLARRRLSTGRVRPPSRGLLLRAHKKKIEFQTRDDGEKRTCAHFPYARDEDGNEKDDATLAPLAPLAIRTPVVKLDDDTAAKFIFTIIESSFGWWWWCLRCTNNAVRLSSVLRCYHQQLMSSLQVF